MSHESRLSLYLQYRQQGDIEACLGLMSENVVLVSEKDGQFQGKKELRKYLEKNPFQGKWSQPYMSPTDNMFRVDGTVKILFMSIKVRISVKLNSSGEIEYVYVGRA